jgi:hypothetical protein
MQADAKEVSWRSAPAKARAHSGGKKSGKTATDIRQDGVKKIVGE